MEDRTFGGRCVATLQLQQQQRSNATGGGEAATDRRGLLFRYTEIKSPLAAGCTSIVGRRAVARLLLRMEAGRT
jgi:hypothetical protein